MPTWGSLAGSYHLKAEYLLTWYPIGETDHLRQPKMLGEVQERSTADFDNPGLGGGTFEVFHLGRGWSPVDTFDSEERIGASLEVGVPPKALFPTFEATVELYVGRVTRRQKLVLPPDTTTAFMLNAHARSDEPRLAKTAAVFQGVFTTGSRLGWIETITRIGG
jgi:hypothetical protein